MNRRFAYYGLGEADEQHRRAFRDGFVRAGLARDRMQAAMEWYRDRGSKLGSDAQKLAADFTDFARGQRWTASDVAAAVDLHAQIAAEGPEAVLDPTSPEGDRDTIARAEALMRSDQAAYWRDEHLQEMMHDAIERQQATPATAASPLKPRCAPSRCS
jgi:hypothetical protein